MFDILASLPPRVYNFLLTLFMSSLVIYFYLHSSDIAKEYSTDETVIQQIIVGAGTVVFFLLSRFESVVGKFLRVLAYIAVGIFVFYITADMQDKTFALIIRSMTGLVVAFGLYGFVSFVYFKDRNEELMKNGWQIDAKFKEVNLKSNEDSSFYVVKLVGRNPATGEELTFESEPIFYNPEDKIKDDQVFTVYVDRNKPQKYCFEEGAFAGLEYW